MRLLKRGVPHEKVQVLASWQKSILFTEEERVSLEYAQAVTIRFDAIGESPIARPQKYFDEDTIVELTAFLAFQNLSSRFNSALGVPPQGFCHLPHHPMNVR
jgi:alkylhydroperoxidase family enzyme